jgi:putative oxidoreductase
MSNAKSILRADFLPTSIDLGLLLLRVWLGASLIALHGMGKWERLMADEVRFRSVFGLSPQISLILAVLGEVVAPLLLMLGFASRWMALLAASMMFFAFTIGHGGALSGQRSGELPFIFLAGFLTLFITGPGRFSIDGRR